MKISYNRGMVLVIALWLIAMLSVFGIGLTRTVLSAERFVRWKIAKTSSYYGMMALVNIVEMRITDGIYGASGEYSVFTDEGEYEAGNVIIQYSITDEEGRININKMGSSVLQEMPGLDLNDAVDIVGSELRPFKLKEELMLLDRIDQDIFNTIKDMITVHGKGKVNINNCSKDIMDILGISDKMASSIIAFRKGTDGVYGTEDDGIFNSLNTIIIDLSQRFNITMQDEHDLKQLMNKGYLTTKSEYYNISATVTDRDRIVDHYSIILGPGKKNSLKIIEWRRT